LREEEMTSNLRSLEERIFSPGRAESISDQIGAVSAQIEPNDYEASPAAGAGTDYRTNGFDQTKGPKVEAD